MNKKLSSSAEVFVEAKQNGQVWKPVKGQTYHGEQKRYVCPLCGEHIAGGWVSRHYRQTNCDTHKENRQLLKSLLIKREKLDKRIEAVEAQIEDGSMTPDIWNKRKPKTVRPRTAVILHYGLR